MGGFDHSFSNTQVLIAAACVLLLAIGLAFRILRRPRISPEEVERQRRLQLNITGKLIAGEIVDVNGWLIVFSYLVAGVAYTASQDVSSLQDLLPENAMSLLGPASVKFDPRNPANSIVICEGWTRAPGMARVEERQKTHAR